MSNIAFFICQYCGTTFIPKYRINKKQGSPIYCSYICCGTSKKSRIENKCKHCGNLFEVQQSRSNAKYCSKKCFQEAIQKPPKFCVDCGKPIKYCSVRCRKCAPKVHAQNSIRNKKISKARKKYWENLQNRTRASECTKKQWTRPSHRKLIKHKMGIFWSNPENRINVSQKAKQRYENPEWHKITGDALRKKWQDSDFRAKHSGNKNPFYINGKYIDLYGPGFTLSLKKEIRARDNFKCRNCGYPENGIALHIHHIDYSKKNHNPDNLISLCKACHDKTLARKNRLKWKLYYQNIMSNKNQLFMEA